MTCKSLTIINRKLCAGSEIEVILLGGVIVMIFFDIMWFIQYPSITLQSLIFKPRDSIGDYMACAGTWISIISPPVYLGLIYLGLIFKT